MPTLLKTTTSKIIGGREFWDLENGFKVMVHENNDYCTLYINGNDDSANIESISKFLETKHMKHQLTPTNGSYAITVSCDEKQVALSVIESWG